MGLGNVAGAADDGRVILALELAGLGAVAYHMGAVIAAEAAHQMFRRAVFFGPQTRHVEMIASGDARIGVDHSIVGQMTFIANDLFVLVFLSKPFISDDARAAILWPANVHFQSYFA